MGDALGGRSSSNLSNFAQAKARFSIHFFGPGLVGGKPFMDSPTEDELRHAVERSVEELRSQVSEQVVEFERHFLKSLGDSLVGSILKHMKGQVEWSSDSSPPHRSGIKAGLGVKASFGMRDAKSSEPLVVENMDQPFQLGSSSFPSRSISPADQYAPVADSVATHETQSIETPNGAYEHVGRMHLNDLDIYVANPDGGTEDDFDDLNKQGVRNSWLPSVSRKLSDSVSRSWSERDDSVFGHFVRSKAFESFYNVVILLNCAAMGIDANRESGKHYDERVVSIMAWCDHISTMLFTIELIARVKAFGIQSFNPQRGDNRWNFLDATLVMQTIFITWLLPLAAMLFGFDSSGGPLRVLSVFRAFRLVRLIKVVSRVPIFREAWMLIRGLTDSFRTLFWTCVVIFFVTYIFAIFGCVLISSRVTDIYAEATNPLSMDFYTPEQIKTLEYLLLRLQGLDRLMVTLIQVLTMDSFHGITYPLMQLEGLGWTWIFWYAYIAVACFVLMNLVTAIIVENAVENGKQDSDAEVRRKEKEMKRELKELEKLFLLMDADESGSLSWDEFKGSFDTQETATKWKLLDFRPNECAEIFCLLDDGDGEIETREFFQGLQKMKGVAMSKDVFRLQKSINKVHANMQKLLGEQPSSPTFSRAVSPFAETKASLADTGKLKPPRFTELHMGGAR